MGRDGNAWEPQETYQEGDIVTLRYGIRANHGGFIRCRICDDPNNMSEACFDQHILRTCALPRPPAPLPAVVPVSVTAA